MSVVKDFSAGRRQKSCQKIEQRRLARTVRADEGVNRMAPNPKIDVVDRDESGKIFAQSPGFEDDLVLEATALCVGSDGIRGRAPDTIEGPVDLAAHRTSPIMEMAA